jgi:hypothetical protein
MKTIALAVGLAAGLSALVAGCNSLRQGRLDDPESYGMERIAPRVYVKAQIGAEQRRILIDSYEKGKQRIIGFWGVARMDPTVYGCDSPECIESFGGWGDGIAMMRKPPAILLWTKVFGPGEVAHEWSHLELNSRLARGAGRTVPAWFHEGLATVVGGIPRHSEAVYQEAVASGFPIPPLSDLITGPQWGAAFKKYPNPKQLNVIYSTAGHVVRAWLERVGEQGLMELIERLGSGEDFNLVYAELEGRRSKPPEQ